MAGTPSKKVRDPRKEIEKYRKAIAADPASRLFAALADALRKTGDVKAAIEVAERGVEKNPRYQSGLVVLAQAYMDDDQDPKALELFARVARMSPENIIAQRAIARIHDRAGDHANALRAYRVIVALDPTDLGARQKLEILEATAPKDLASTPSPPAPRPGEASDSSTTGIFGAALRDPDASETSAVSLASALADAGLPFTPPHLQRTASVQAFWTEDNGAPAPPAPEDPGPQAVPDDEKTTELAIGTQAPPPPGLEPAKETAAATSPGAKLGDFFIPPQADLADPAQPQTPTAEPTAADPAPTPPPAAPDAPSAPPLPPAAQISDEEKLDRFFAGFQPERDEATDSSALIDPPGPAATPEELRQALNQSPGPDPESDPTADAGATDPDQPLQFASSQLAALYWDQGFQQKAVGVLAEQLRDDLKNPGLIHDFKAACHALGEDPAEVLLRATVAEPPFRRPDLEGPGAASTSDLETDTIMTTAPESEPPRPQDGTPAAPVGPRPDLPKADKIDILRSYLVKIRENKGETQ